MYKIEKFNARKERNSSFELLRILAMFLVVCFHFSDHGVIVVENMQFSFNKFVLELARLGGGFGNCIFILICGYFMIDSKITKNKIIKLYTQVSFYSILLGILAIHLNLLELNFINIIKIIFPITYNQYWWFTVYFILILLIPYINKLIKSLSKTELKKLITTLLIIFSVIPTITNTNYLYNHLGFFINVYLIGAFIKKYKNDSSNLKDSIILTVVWLLSCIVLILICDFTKSSDIFKYVYPMQKTPILFLAISVFLLFKNIKIRNNKIINSISKTTFGIYLIHMNMYVWPIIWRNFFDNSVYFNRKCFPLVMIIECLIVFVICSLIDFLRIKIFSLFIKK